jgi:hypothetical protein
MVLFHSDSKGYCDRYLLWWCTDWDFIKRYELRYTNISMYTGSYTIGWDLDPVAIALLADDGILEYSLSATGGGNADVIFKDATLTFNVEPNVTFSPVPTPAALVLFASASLTLIGFARRGSS